MSDQPAEPPTDSVSLILRMWCAMDSEFRARLLVVSDGKLLPILETEDPNRLLLAVGEQIARVRRIRPEA